MSKQICYNDPYCSITTPEHLEKYSHPSIDGANNQSSSSKRKCQIDKFCDNFNENHTSQFNHPKRDEWIKKSNKTEEKPVCEYDMQCKRKNPDHFKEFSHPKKDAFEKKYPSHIQSQTGDKSGGKPFDNKKPDVNYKKSDATTAIDYRPMCRYGAACYQTNPKHLKDFQHPNPSSGHNENSGNLAGKSGGSGDGGWGNRGDGSWGNPNNFQKVSVLPNPNSFSKNPPLAQSSLPGPKSYPPKPVLIDSHPSCNPLSASGRSLFDQPFTPVSEAFSNPTPAGPTPKLTSSKSGSQSSSASSLPSKTHSAAPKATSATTKTPSAAGKISSYFDAPYIISQPLSASRDTKAEADEWNRLEKEQQLLKQQNQPQQGQRQGQGQSDDDDEEEEVLAEDQEVFDLLDDLEKKCKGGGKTYVDDVVLPVKGPLEQLLSVLENSAALYLSGDKNTLWQGRVLREQKPEEVQITGQALSILIYMASTIFSNDDVVPSEKRLAAQEKMKSINGFKFLYNLFFVPHEVKAKSGTIPFVMVPGLPLNTDMSWKTKAAIVLALFHTELPLPPEMSPVARLLGHSLRATMAKLLPPGGSGSAGAGTGAGGVDTKVVEATNRCLLRILEALTGLAKHLDNCTVLMESYGKGGAGITLPTLYSLLDPHTMPSEEAAVNASQVVLTLSTSKQFEISNKAIGYCLSTRPSESDNWSLLALIFQCFCDKPDPQSGGGDSSGSGSDSDDSSVTKVVFNLCGALRNVLAGHTEAVERFMMGVVSPVNGGKHVLGHKLLLSMLEKAFALSPIPTNIAMVTEDQAFYVGIVQRCVACFVECTLCGKGETKELIVGTNLIRDIAILIKHCTSRLESPHKTKKDSGLIATVVQLSYNILALNDSTFRDAFGIDAVVNLARLHDLRTSASASGNLMGLYVSVSITLLLRGIVADPEKQKPYNAAIKTVIAAEAELKTVGMVEILKTKGEEYLKMCQQAGNALDGLGGKWDVLKKRK